MVKLMVVQHQMLAKAKDFDPQRNRQEVLQRLEARIADARTLPEQRRPLNC